MGAFTDITVGLLNGGLEQEVVVTVSTQADTAMGKFIYLLAMVLILLSYIIQQNYKQNRF